MRRFHTSIIGNRKQKIRMRGNSSKMHYFCYLFISSLGLFCISCGLPCIIEER